MGVELREADFESHWLDFVSALEGILIVRGRRPRARFFNALHPVTLHALEQGRHPEFIRELQKAVYAVGGPEPGLNVGVALHLEIVHAVDGYMAVTGLGGEELNEPPIKSEWTDPQASARGMANAWAIILDSIGKLSTSLPFWAQLTVQVLREAAQFGGMEV